MFVRLPSAFLSLTLSLPLVLSSGGCDVEPPNVGDPYALPYWVLDKTILDSKNDWWLQRTMTQVPYEAGFTFVGDADLTDRVHFKIEEHWLIAYRTSEVYFANDSDVETADETSPALAYPIIRHVDVIDGQQIEAPNKPWYERTHVVVDWGSESSGTYRFTLGSVETSGVKYWTMEPNDVDEAPVFSASYIDFTSHVLVSPSEQFDPETEQPGFCSPNGLGSQLYVDAVSCSPMDVAFRTSLRRVPKTDDYEPVTSDDAAVPPSWFDRFFRVARVDIDDQYGATLPGRARFLSRYNIWAKSSDHGTRIPLADRAVRPIVFHLSEGFPADLKDIARSAVDAWDVAFRSSVKQARAAECTDAGGVYDSCQASAEEPEHVLVLCPNNPVQKGDNTLCGKRGTRARLGDLRFNLIQWVKQPNVNHPVGLAWWSPDLTTGETVAGVAKVYGDAIDKAATVARDAVLLATGELTASDVTSGRYLGDYAGLLQAYSQNPFGHVGPTTPGASIAPSEPPLDVGPAAADAPMAPALGLFRDTAFAPIVGTPLESLTLDADALMMAGVDPRTVAESEGISEASPLRASMKSHSDARRALARIVGQAAGDLDLPADIDLGSLIDAAGGTDGDAIYAEARRRFSFTVIAHELGHVFAIKHNFAGSYDALNYQDGYWEHRDTTCVGPRYSCPLTAAEEDARLEDYAYSSIMDYHPSANSYVHGLGHFDIAAIHALYGGVAEVFEDEGLKDRADPVLYLTAMYQRDQVAHVPLVLAPDAADPRGYHLTSYHYSRLPQLFGDLSARRFVSARSLTDGLGDGVLNSDADGRLVVPYLSCNDVEVGDLPYCLAYDHGADPFEIVTAQTNWWKAYYPFNSFRRGRLVFEPSDYIFGVWSRVFLPIKRWNDWLIHTHFDYDLKDPGAYDDPDFLEPMRVAADVGFQFLAEVLATPEPGSYFTEPQPDGSTMLQPFRQPISHTEPIPTGEVMKIQFPEGRIYQSAAAYDAGLILLNVGSAVDKELALEALLDPSFFQFPGRGSWDQTDLWMVNYYNTHPSQVLDLVGSLVAGDWARLGGRYTSDVSYRDFNDVTSTQAGQIVDPAVGFNLRIRALVYGIGLIYSGYADRSFLESVRVVIAGSGEEPTTTAVPVDFVDPSTLRPYRAYSQLVNGVEVGVGARVLQQAQAIADVVADPTTTAEELVIAQLALGRQIDLIEIMRSVVQRYDEAGFTGVNPDTQYPQP